jgi:hypothetical protein
MPIAPIITFKAGQCEVDVSLASLYVLTSPITDGSFSQDGSSRPLKVKPQPQPGYIYLYSEDGKVPFSISSWQS